MARIPRRLPRDTILFFGGLSGIGYETIVGKAERPTLLILFGAMIGLPAFLRSDESRQDKKDDADRKLLNEQANESGETK